MRDFSSFRSVSHPRKPQKKKPQPEPGNWPWENCQLGNSIVRFPGNNLGAKFYHVETYNKETARWLETIINKKNSLELSITT